MPHLRHCVHSYLAQSQSISMLLQRDTSRAEQQLERHSHLVLRPAHAAVVTVVEPSCNCFDKIATIDHLRFDR
eukprot:102738-Pelagomonas_calceolata.AAC.2